MKTGVEDLVGREVVVKLLKDHFLKNLTKWRKNCYWSIIGTF